MFRNSCATLEEHLLICVSINYTASLSQSCVFALAPCFNYTMMYCADILNEVRSRGLTSRVYAAMKAIDFVVRFCDIHIGELIPLNNGTVDFNSSRYSDIFVGTGIAQSV